MATQIIGGTLADLYGGRVAMALGIVWFSAASALLPLAVSAPVAAAGLTLPAVLAARCAVVSRARGLSPTGCLRPKGWASSLWHGAGSASRLAPPTRLSL